MALGLWKIGVKDITCVEARAVNIKKGEFVKKFFGANYKYVQDDAENFLKLNLQKFEEYCREYCKNLTDAIIRNVLIKQIEKYSDRNGLYIIVTANKCCQWVC